MKRLGVFLLPPFLDGMLANRRVTPSSKFADTHLYTWVISNARRWNNCYFLFAWNLQFGVGNLYFWPYLSNSTCFISRLWRNPGQWNRRNPLSWFPKWLPSKPKLYMADLHPKQKNRSDTQWVQDRECLWPPGGRAWALGNSTSGDSLEWSQSPVRPSGDYSVHVDSFHYKCARQWNIPGFPCHV